MGAAAQSTGIKSTGVKKSIGVKSCVWQPSLHPGAVYHVTSRGDRREPIYPDDEEGCKNQDLTPFTWTFTWNFIEKCARAGVRRIGLENINPENPLGAKKRQNRITEYRNRLLAWKSARVITYAGYILGFPNDTVDSILQRRGGGA